LKNQNVNEIRPNEYAGPAGVKEQIRFEAHSQLDNAMIGELQAICRTFGDDINALRALMDDAVGNLTRTFESIIDSTRTEQSDPDGHVKGEASGLAADVGEKAEEAVMYLQFHDLAAQMMDNLERRARAVEQGAGCILDGDMRGAAEAFAQTSSIRARQPQSSQVRAGGDIDLF
jgi:hypothetical protein